MQAALKGLDPRNAERVAGHLVAAGTLVDERPDEALAHARAARDRASRVAAVREAVGVAAYHAGDYAEAARELRAYRRMSGDQGYRAVLADCERALGRPEVALRLVREAFDQGPDADEATELRLVEAGARRDLGELAAARQVLEEALGGRRHPDALDLQDEATLRLATAYADLLTASGETEAAEPWQTAVAAVDTDDVEFSEEDPAERVDDLAVAGEETDDAAPPAGEHVPDDAPDGLPDDAPDGLPDDASDGVTDADIEAEVAELLGEIEPPDTAPQEH